MTLGVWHPYKQANTVVWGHWGPRFLAPFFNDIVPGSNFQCKARLVTIITYFTHIRLAAPSLAKQLQDAIKTARADRARPLVLCYLLLLDLRTLVFFCIPVVRCLHAACLRAPVSCRQACLAHATRFGRVRCCMVTCGALILMVTC